MVLSVILSFVFSFLVAFMGYESLDSKKQALWFIFAFFLLAYMVFGCYYIETH